MRKFTSMTVHERLAALGADEAQIRTATELLGSLLPVRRPVVVTDGVLDAARRGDAGLVSLLLLEEVDPEPDELEAIRDAQASDDGSTIGFVDVLRVRREAESHGSA